MHTSLPLCEDQVPLSPAWSGKPEQGHAPGLNCAGLDLNMYMYTVLRDSSLVSLQHYKGYSEVA